jgi:hypothetical protein
LRAWVKKEGESVVDTKILDIQLVSTFLVANGAKELGLAGNKQRNSRTISLLTIWAAIS